MEGFRDSRIVGMRPRSEDGFAAKAVRGAQSCRLQALPLFLTRIAQIPPVVAEVVDLAGGVFAAEIIADNRF